MGKYQAYEKYKYSGFKWLGEIPEHWKICKLKRTVNIFGRIGFRGYTTQDIVLEGEGAITLSPSNILDGKINYSNRTYLSWEKYHESPEIQVFNKDILFVKTGSTIGKVAIVENMPEPMTINPQLVVLKEINCCPEFLAYLMNANFYQFQVMGFRFGGSTPAMTQESLGQTQVILPPLDEQKTIAHFLDHKTKQIDDLIAKKEALLEKLDEKRTALISHAVTKGLDPNVPMKDSGVEWLGKIPEHWKVIQIKRAFILQRGVDITQEDQTEGVVPVVSSGGIASYHNVAYAKSPGVLVGRKGTIGNVHYVDVDYWPHDTTLWVIEFYKNNPRFIYYKLLSMNLKDWDTGSANPTLNRNLIHPLKTPWTSSEEQEKIAKYLDNKTTQIEQQKNKIKEAIELLKEYRTALITNAVTGKIDVRQVPIP